MRKVSRILGVLRELLWPPSAFLFARIALFSVLLPGLLRLKLPKLMELLAPKASAKTSSAARVDRVVRYTGYVLRVKGPSPGKACLVRSLTLFYFLAREGLDLSVCLGVARADGQLRGHCWLEQHGKPFLEKTDPHSTFALMYVFPQNYQPSPGVSLKGIKWG